MSLSLESGSLDIYKLVMEYVGSWLIPSCVETTMPAAHMIDIYYMTSDDGEVAATGSTQGGRLWTG